MIQLTRDRTQISSAFWGQRLRNKLEWLFQQQQRVVNDEIESIHFSSGRSYWKTAKEQLEKETHRKCAYCEADTKVVAHGDVEHFRPKSIYWWLAYTYDNYLFSCQICNQIYKLDNFPVRNNRVVPPPVLAQMSATELSNLFDQFSLDPRDIQIEQSIVSPAILQSQEDPDLINPYFEDPEQFFHWEFDDVLKAVKLIADHQDNRSQRYTQAAIDYYGLNREPLLHGRYKYFRMFRNLKKTLDHLPGPLRAETQQEIDFMKSAESPYAGMIRYFDQLPLQQIS